VLFNRIEAYLSIYKHGMKLTSSFYEREDVVQISKDLLGKYLISFADGLYTAGMITETEAYSGQNDKACHAHLNRRTDRTEIMYHNGGLAYVYLCYGLHSLFNIVTNQKGNADAVLIRAIEPTEGLEVMQQRRGMATLSPRLTAGPGVMSKAMGISKSHYGTDLQGDTLWIEDRGIHIPEKDMIACPRIGVDYAEEDALLPWRFYIKGNPYVSKKAPAAYLAKT
jgi:DNA-3-methyladenine glycosylase